MLSYSFIDADKTHLLKVYLVKKLFKDYSDPELIG